MAENSNIQWTNHTWNPWHGCKKVSSGCRYCYMFRDKARYNQDPTSVVRSAKATFEKPNTWKSKANVFTCSWSDFFIEDADEWRSDAWEIIKKNPHLTFQILTKRPERIKQCLPKDWGQGYNNVWLGISCENQAAYNHRSPYLEAISAKVKFLSLEPLLSLIKLDKRQFGVDWIIVGGESGNTTGAFRFRRTDIDWIHSIVKNVPRGTFLFIKQLGTHLANKMKLVSKHGTNPKEWPENLQIRNYPKEL